MDGHPWTPKGVLLLREKWPEEVNKKSQDICASVFTPAPFKVTSPNLAGCLPVVDVPHVGGRDWVGPCPVAVGYSLQACAAHQRVAVLLLVESHCSSDNTRRWAEGGGGGSVDGITPRKRENTRQGFDGQRSKPMGYRSKIVDHGCHAW